MVNYQTFEYLSNSDKKKAIEQKKKYLKNLVHYKFADLSLSTNQLNSLKKEQESMIVQIYKFECQLEIIN